MTWPDITINIFGKKMDGVLVLNVIKFLLIWKNFLNIKNFILIKKTAFEKEQLPNLDICFSQIPPNQYT